VNGNSVHKQYHWSATVYINNTIGLVITQTCKSKLFASWAGHVLQTWLAGPKTALHLPRLLVHWLVHAITTSHTLLPCGFTLVNLMLLWV